MMFAQAAAVKVAKKVKVGGIAHIGEFCIVKYGRDNFHIYKAGYLFSTLGHMGQGRDVADCVARVFILSQADTLRVIIDNN
jgi:hypothetical protein